MGAQVIEYRLGFGIHAAGLQYHAAGRGRLDGAQHAGMARLHGFGFQQLAALAGRDQYPLTPILSRTRERG